MSSSSQNKTMEPIYTDLASGDSFEGERVGNEEKLLAHFNHRQESRPRLFSLKCVWNWLAKRNRSRDSAEENLARPQRLQSFLRGHPVVFHLLLVFTYSIICFLVVSRPQQSRGCSSVIYSKSLLRPSLVSQILSLVSYSPGPGSRFTGSKGFECQDQPDLKYIQCRAIAGS